MRILAIAAAAVTLVGLSLAAPSQGHATPITGGSTIVSPTLDLSPFDVSLLGSAGAGILFPVTGGDLDDALAGRIEHEGSGVSLASGGQSLSLENFIIDTTQGTVFGDVSVNGTRIADDAALFDLALGALTAGQITDLANPAIVLTLTGTAVGAFDTVFGVELAAGTQFGLAATAPQFGGQVPAPGGLALVVLGLGTVVARRRRAT